MTYTFKLARRLARLRTVPALLLPLLAACAAREPTGVSTEENPPINPGVGQSGPVVITPRTVTIERSQVVLFRAFESLVPGSAQVTAIEWSATGGTIGADGRYTPAATGSFKVLGRRKGNPHNPPDTAVVTVVPPPPTLVAVEITPSTATVGAGLQQQFSAVGRQSDSSTAPIGVEWTATGGSIDAGGLYTAGPAAGRYRVIATHVTTGLADTAVVTVPAAVLTSISLTPASVSLSDGQGQHFTVIGQLSDGTAASVPVTFAATGGSISATGDYTAGSTAGSFSVIATADGGLADTSAVTITTTPPPPPPPPPPPTLSSIVLTPASVSLGAGQTQQFSVTGKLSDGATSAVSPTYAATGGTISAAGLYTAGSTAGAFRVIATAQGKADTSAVTITVPATLNWIVLTPASVSLTPGQGQQFGVTGKLSDGTTSAVSPVYTATGGTISAAGYYTAGANSGSFRVIATASSKADTSAVTIAAPPPPPPPPPSGSVLWNATLENGVWPTGTGIIQCAAGRVTPFTAASKPYASAPNPRSGFWAVKFETRDTDLNCGGTSNLRSQAESPRVMVQGGEYWLSESVYFPTDFPSIDKWYFMFTELYSPVGGGQPAVGLYLSNGPSPKISFNAGYNAATASNHTVASLTFSKGQWVDLLMHIKVSTNPSGGFIELYKDGVNVPLSGGVTTNGVSRLTCQTMLAVHAAGGMAMTLNDYRSADNTTSSGATMLYFDESKVGTSRAAVDPRASSTSQLLAMQP